MKVYSLRAMAALIIGATCCVQAQAQGYYASAYNSDARPTAARSLNAMTTSHAHLAEEHVGTGLDAGPSDEFLNEEYLGGGLGGGRCGDTGCMAGCCAPCADACPAIEFWMDATFFRFHKTGGVNVGNSDQGVADEENAELGYFLSPRFNMRYYNSSGMYWQLSYFEFNHGTLLTANDAGSHIGVRSWTFDSVVGERFMLNRKWTIDWNGGLRLYNYSETAIDRDEVSLNNPEFNFDHSWGIGGILGIEGTRSIGNGLSVYGRAKLGIIHGDHTVAWNRDGTFVNRQLLDENFIHTEFATGVEYSTCTACGVEVIAKAGAEWITYEDASSAFAVGAPETSRAAGADVGYGGVTFSLGFYR